MGFDFMNLTEGIAKYLLRKGLWEGSWKGSWKGFQFGWFLGLRQWIDGVCPPKPCPFIRNEVLTLLEAWE